MLVIPAIDLSDGDVVRLSQGRMEEKTVYSNDPVQMALRWQEEGAQWLHVVDLDAAIIGDRDNRDVIAQLARALSIPIELGGGIRSLEAVENALNLGVERVVIGTSALSDPEMVREAVKRYGEHVVVGIDARDGKVAVRGWTEVSEIGALELARKVEEMGVRRLICTDIRTDGMLKGPNIPAMRELAEAVSIPIIASGGVSGLDDVRALCALAKELAADIDQSSVPSSRRSADEPPVPSSNGSTGVPSVPSSNGSAGVPSVPSSNGSAGVPPARSAGVRQLRPGSPGRGIEGCIVGRALYTGALSLREAIEVAKQC